MKILHTSDLHLGHQIYGYDRTGEHQAMLLQLENIVRERQPDVLLICGDVYHTSQPSAAVQKMFTEAIVRMHVACAEMSIVVTAGNHDSGTRHEIFQTPWRALNVQMVGNVDKDAPENHIIEIKNKGFIVALPYSSGRNLPKEFYQQLLDAVAERNAANLPVVMTAHTTVSGCSFKGHDHASEYSVGGIDAYEVEDMGKGYDYLALGHIHHAQDIRKGIGHVRYSGTPIAVSFDETYSHNVSLVEIDKHGTAPVIELIDIENPRPLVTLPTEGAADWNTCKKLLENYPSDIPAYIRLNVEVNDFLPPAANAEAEALTREKQCRFCLINSIRKANTAENVKEMTVQEFQDAEPINIAHEFSKAKNIEFDKEMQEMFNEVLQAIEQDKQEDRL